MVHPNPKNTSGKAYRDGRWGSSEAGPLKQSSATTQLSCGRVGGLLDAGAAGRRGVVTPFLLIRNGEVPKRSNGADCKSAGLAFGGSNPPLSTTGWYGGQ